MELREQCWLDAVACLVTRPDTVAKRLDDVIGGNADVSCSLLDHLQQRLQHADHGAERPVLTLGKATQPVEVTEQLVRAVDKVHDHERIMPLRGTRSFSEKQRLGMAAIYARFHAREFRYG